MPPFGVDSQLVVFAVWVLLVVIGSVAGVVAILISWLGRPGGMLIGGVVLGAGLAVLLAMLYSLPRYWWMGIVPVALGIQTLRMYRGRSAPEPRSRWAVQLSTVCLWVAALSACLAGVTSIQQQRKREAILTEAVESAGGYVVHAFDGTVSTVLFRNQSAEALAGAAPMIMSFRQIKELGLEGTPVSSDLLSQFATQLPHLENLSLQNAKLTGKLGEALARFENLRMLDLMKTDVGDEDLPPLAKLTGLERLYLNGTSATPAAIRKLRALLPQAEISGD